MSFATYTVTRTGEHGFVAGNGRGEPIKIGRKGAEGSYSPGELLQIALAGCAAVTAEEVIGRRVEGGGFSVSNVGDRSDVAAEFDGFVNRFEIPGLDDVDDATRAVLEKVVRDAIAKLCTVSRTVEKGTPVAVTFQ